MTTPRDAGMPGEQLRAQGYRCEHDPAQETNAWKVRTGGTIGIFVAPGNTEAEAWANAEDVEARMRAAEDERRRPFPVLLEQFRRWDERWDRRLRKSGAAAEDSGDYSRHDEAAADMREEKEEWTYRLVGALPQSRGEWRLIRAALRKAAKGPNGEAYARVLETIERGA